MNLIETKRLCLRRLELHDASFIFDLLNQPGFIRYIGDKGVRTRRMRCDYILKGPIDSYRRHGFGLYLTALREVGTPIGICGIVKRDTLPTWTWASPYAELRGRRAMRPSRRRRCSPTAARVRARTNRRDHRARTTGLRSR